MSFPQLATNQSNKEARINETNLSGAVAYLFGRDVSVGGLQLKIQGGDGLPATTVRWGATLPVDTTLTLTATTTAYVVAAKATGAITSATNTTNWNDTSNYGRIGVATVGASAVTAWVDHRQAEYGTHNQGSGGGGGQPNIQFQDEGSNVGTAGGVSTVNFVGAGVTASFSAGVLTVTVSGGGGGATAFTGLTDTFASYSGRMGQAPRVNGAQTALITDGTLTAKTASFTFAASDLDMPEVESSGATNITGTVPPNSSVAFPIGTTIPLRRTGTGTFTLAQGAGVTINSDGGFVLGAGRAFAVLQKVGTDTWDLVGQLAGNANRIVDVAYAQYTTYTSDTGVIPQDDTIPQVSEGTQILSAAITPKSTTNKIRYRAVVPMGASGIQALCAAIFVNGASNAIAAAVITAEGNARQTFVIIEGEYTPSSTSAQTFTVRSGLGIAGTYYLNGTNSSRIFGGVLKSSLVLEEIAA